MIVWKKKSQEEIKEKVFNALGDNINYSKTDILGVPASYLDEKIFSQDKSFLKEAPFLSTLIQNPNHIGCHTLGTSESFFTGTQEIEKELLEICAVDILKGKKGEQDGYIASGGTEANIQTIWIYRNYFKEKYNATLNEICIICSEDSHYSMDKAANLLSIDLYKIKVENNTRKIHSKYLNEQLINLKEKGKKYFITIANMMTTMYGSVDDIDVYIKEFNKLKINYKIHVDGAFGGFYYPFSENENNKLTFQNPAIDSFTLDAHKMAQAPYGTGIFLIRKGYMNFANTKEASYVEGEDCTLIGSRSGANAIAVWMILTINGPYGWSEKIFILQKRTDWACNELAKMNIEFYRHPKSNIIAIKQEFVHPSIAQEFGLVPDNHRNPSWYKIVVMEHVTIEKIIHLLSSLKTKK